MTTTLSSARVKEILARARKAKLMVLGDLMLDQFVWGSVRRISPEAPVPVIDFERESLMPGGAANVARNLTSFGVPTELFGVLGRDHSAHRLKQLLAQQNVGCGGIVLDKNRITTVKTRFIAHQQQIVRVDRENIATVTGNTFQRLLTRVEEGLEDCDALIIGDYAKGVLSQSLLDRIKGACAQRGVWLSIDPKPSNKLDLKGASLLTPNRKEAFELAGIKDGHSRAHPMEDAALLEATELLLQRLAPKVLLVTLGDQGMLLCKSGEQPFHIRTVAQEVFDVSGAGDTVIATFSMAIAAGSSPREAAIISNHAAGIVVGKLGTATLTKQELLASFQPN
jgi:D-glycero-beta-D-manno-heptose-7-phosphate kinase